MQRFGEHPHADREFAPLEAQHEEGDGDREQRRPDRPREQGWIGGKSFRREPDGEIGADPEERLLPDGDEPGVARQRVPHRGENDVDEQGRQLVHDIGAGEERRDGERQDNDRDDDAENGRFAGPALDGELRRLDHPRSPNDERRPPRARAQSRNNRRARTTRNVRWPASRNHFGSNAAPIDCARPSTIPPISVPHSDPMPPITTASKAKMSCIGPEYGSKVARMASIVPASATVATAIAAATA